jgi:hypothetical protein
VLAIASAEYQLQTCPASFIIDDMVKKVTQEMMRLVQSQLASAGGKARAEKYDRATLSRWAKLGGRPRKKKPGSHRKGNA